MTLGDLDKWIIPLLLGGNISLCVYLYKNLVATVEALRKNIVDIHSCIDDANNAAIERRIETIRDIEQIKGGQCILDSRLKQLEDKQAVFHSENKESIKELSSKIDMLSRTTTVRPR
jgi:predicted RecB family endonuclease